MDDRELKKEIVYQRRNRVLVNYTREIILVFFNFFSFYMQNEIFTIWKTAYFMAYITGLRGTLCLPDLHNALAPPSISDVKTAF